MRVTSVVDSVTGECSFIGAEYEKKQRRVSFTTDKIPVVWHRLLVEALALGVCAMDTKHPHVMIAVLLSV
jgi:hypothetical protein